jgi:RimJ/RimL family protein N-acetyltransferase
MLIRPTTYEDIESIEKIFSHARWQMAEDGNPTQWGDGYPEREILEQDIARGVSFVIEHEGVICGTFVFIVGDDPTYAHIEGEWLDNVLPYGTIHRITSNGQNKGVFRSVLDWCIAHCSNIRIDTHADNTRMIHLIEQAGFTHCGIIYTRKHSPRIAYQQLF